MIDGKLYCRGEPVLAQDQSTSTPIGALDITTGVFEPLHVVPFEARVLDVIGIKDELMYALVLSDRGALLLALGSEGIVWERPPASSLRDDCRLLGDHIGCVDWHRYSVLDRHTGKMVLSGERPSA